MKRTFCRSVALTLCLALGAATAPAQAQWHTRELPGLVSGKSIVIELLVGGGLVSWLLVAKHRRAIRIASSPLQAAERLEFGAAESSKSISISNHGSEALSLSEVGFSGKGFASTLVTPVPLPPGGTVDVPVSRDVQTAGKRARLMITALTPQGKSIDRVVELRLTR